MTFNEFMYSSMMDNIIISTTVLSFLSLTIAYFMKKYDEIKNDNDMELQKLTLLRVSIFYPFIYAINIPFISIASITTVKTTTLHEVLVENHGGIILLIGLLCSIAVSAYCFKLYKGIEVSVN